MSYMLDRLTVKNAGRLAHHDAELRHQITKLADARTDAKRESIDENGTWSWRDGHGQESEYQGQLKELLDMVDYNPMEFAKEYQEYEHNPYVYKANYIFEKRLAFYEKNKSGHPKEDALSTLSENQVNILNDFWNNLSVNHREDNHPITVAENKPANSLLTGFIFKNKLKNI